MRLPSDESTRPKIEQLKITFKFYFGEYDIKIIKSHVVNLFKKNGEIALLSCEKNRNRYVFVCHTFARHAYARHTRMKTILFRAETSNNEFIFFFSPSLLVF